MPPRPQQHDAATLYAHFDRLAAHPETSVDYFNHWFWWFWLVKTLLDVIQNKTLQCEPNHNIQNTSSFSSFWCFRDWLSSYHRRLKPNGRALTEAMIFPDNAQNATERMTRSKITPKQILKLITNAPKKPHNPLKLTFLPSINASCLYRTMPALYPQTTPGQ